MLISSSGPVYGGADEHTGTTVEIGGVLWTIGEPTERYASQYSAVTTYRATTTARWITDSNGRRRKVRPDLEITRCGESGWCVSHPDYEWWTA